MKPGSTIMSLASITVACALMSGRTAVILLPSISTSAVSKSPTPRSKLSTTPPLMSVRDGLCAKAGTLAAAPATSVAAADAMKRRRLVCASGRTARASSCMVTSSQSVLFISRACRNIGTPARGVDWLHPVARMERSEIRDDDATCSAAPAFRCAPCGLQSLPSPSIIKAPSGLQVWTLLRRQPRRLDDLFGAHAIVDQKLAELFRCVHHWLERALDHVAVAERRLVRNAHDLAA